MRKGDNAPIRLYQRALWQLAGATLLIVGCAAWEDLVGQFAQLPPADDFLQGYFAWIPLMCWVTGVAGIGIASVSLYRYHRALQRGEV